MKDKTTATGEVVICLRDANGKIKDRTTVNNKVVTDGREHIVDQLTAQLQGQMSHMAIGIGDGAGGYTDPELTDEGLENQLSILDFATYGSISPGTGGDSNKVIYICEWDSTTPTGAITEAGIFNAATNGVMLCRNGFNVKNKGAGDSLTLTWTITITS